MGLKIYNTFTREKEEFVPREEGKVSIYTCGPTVYNYIHIGNARTFLNFDMIRRYFAFLGYEVTYVQNITDVDDKIINRANEEGIDPAEVASKYLDAFNRDMDELGVARPDINPKATEHIEDMLKVISGLVENGSAYVSEGDVYFDVSGYPGYGELSGRSLEEQQVTSQCGVEMERKNDPNDFALWKSSKPGEPYWDSPWGPGRPGWHIECSTMSVKYLGDDFDIHGGGQDLIFPHHENERAQAEAFSGGRRFAKYWMHSGMLNMDKEKMSKSLGNIKSLREVLDEYHPEVLRILALGTHYRNPLNFSDRSLEEAKATLERIQNCMFNLNDLLKHLEKTGSSADRDMREEKLFGDLEKAESEFRECMDDDFNSAAALGVVFNIIREVNAYIAEIEQTRSLGGMPALLESELVLSKLLGALGLSKAAQGYTDTLAIAESAAGREAGPTVGELQQFVQGLSEQIEAGPETEALTLFMDERKSTIDSASAPEELIELALDIRQIAREARLFEFADEIRDGITGLGIRVEDGAEGSRWRLDT